MAISDLLNRRVRARPEEDEEIYSDEAPSEIGNKNEGSEASDSENGSEHGSNEADDLVWLLGFPRVQAHNELMILD